MYGIVSDLYRNIVRLKTNNGDIVIKSNKKMPKGLKVEIKNIGQGDYKGKILMGPSKVLPSLDAIYYSSMITEDRSLVEKLSFLFEELSKRVKIDRSFLEKFKKYFEAGEVDEDNKVFGNYVNLLSGRYGFRSFGMIKIFVDRKAEEFVLYFKDNVIKGKVEGNDIILSTDKIIENIEELKERLKKYFLNVYIKYENFEGGIYV
ncbi:hypothetical protein [Thermosipho sp. (in: thermotogales)]|uniref:hypothetical protein n=1 Tax=Thermosipho sp. (in: thermotogales) TaxID=1968895 RepID=UPI00257C67E9|nr:hypothetical protein [Thermosipho sp. (in: thermotogales)]MBZ4650331.1 hypothetical protein [Thermosipho sp. (in: thermotogales)]